MTSNNAPATHQQKPPIVLSADDYERLSGLAYVAMNRMPSLAAALTEELERARVLPKGSQPQHIVCMNSEVEFRNESSGRIQKVTLVYPGEADISEGKVSVLTPVGTALIGLGRDNPSPGRPRPVKFVSSQYSKCVTPPPPKRDLLIAFCHAAAGSILRLHESRAYWRKPLAWKVTLHRIACCLS
jgi:regulator of nucleoside diphosphate kinase